jgi:threonine aldolase
MRRMMYTSTKSPINSAKYRYDLRSDTVTKPSPAMLEAIQRAEVGDDVFGDDPTVIQLQDRMRDLTGKQSALFVVSGTMSNQIAIRSHLTSPPYSVVLDKTSHMHQYEAGGISFHCGAQVIPLTPKNRFLSAEEIENELILDDDIHHARTQIIVLENAMDG